MTAVDVDWRGKTVTAEEWYAWRARGMSTGPYAPGHTRGSFVV